MSDTYLDKQRIDASIRRDIGAIIDALIVENSDISIADAIKLVYKSELYKKLTDHTTYYYLLDTLELYNKLKQELAS